MTGLAFPITQEPSVSVLMPTFGGWSYVERALRALKESTDPGYELIIVDDASPDDLPDRLRSEVTGARIVFSERNLGFGPAVNQAAALARGWAMVLLNSDAMVHPGWLPPLLSQLGTAGVGAVAPRLLNLDGTLQEAGCVIFSGANTWLYGLGDDPELPPYRQPRDVDYASAACLLVSRRAFYEVGGLNPAYAPAYFEDVELCLALRSRGWRCVFEPRSLVTHVRGASTPPEVSARSWERSAAIFRERWASLLEARPPFGPATEPGWSRRQLAARDAAAARRILLVTSHPKRCLTSGGDTAAASLVAGLVHRRPRACTTLLALSGGPGDDQLEGALDEIRRLGFEADATSDPGGWLSARRYHYDVVIADGAETSRRLRPSLPASQPQAAVLLIAAPLGGAAGRAGRALVEALEEIAAADAVLVSRQEDGRLVAALLPDADAALLRRVSGEDRGRCSDDDAEALVDSILARVGVGPPSLRLSRPGEDLYPSFTVPAD